MLLAGTLSSCTWRPQKLPVAALPEIVLPATVEPEVQPPWLLQKRNTPLPPLLRNLLFLTCKFVVGPMLFCVFKPDKPLLVFWTTLLVTVTPA